jgi:hypothetical protein
MVRTGSTVRVRHWALHKRRNRRFFARLALLDLRTAVINDERSYLPYLRVALGLVWADTL